MTTLNNQSTTTSPNESPARNAVRSCVCFGVSFDEIREAAGDADNPLLEAHRKTGCGGRCGLCLPYIKLMLRTGKTELPVMWSKEFDEEGINAGRVRSIEKAAARKLKQLEEDRAKDASTRSDRKF